MIRFLDAVTLARTKLKSRRIRLYITVVVSSLMFGFIATGITVIRGIDDSMTKFLSEASHGVSTAVLSENEGRIGRTAYVDPYDATTVKQVTEIHKQIITEKKRLADKYDVAYDEKTEVPPTLLNPEARPGIPERDQMVANTRSEAYRILVNQHTEDQVKPSTASDVHEHLRRFGYSNIRELVASVKPGVAYLKNGTELFGKARITEELKKESGGEPGEINAVKSSEYGIVDASVTDNYLIPGIKRDRTAVPVVISVDDAYGVLRDSEDFPAKPEGNAERIIWGRRVVERVAGMTYSACYRNDASKGLVEKAESLGADTLQAKKQNTKVPIEYGIPTTSCGPVRVLKDNRTDREKADDENKRLFDQAISGDASPRQELLKFQIVGIVPSAQQVTYTGDSLTFFLSSAMSYQGMQSVLIPKQEYSRMAPKYQHRDILGSTSQQQTASQSILSYLRSSTSEGEKRLFLVDFTNAEEAKRYARWLVAVCSDPDSESCAGVKFYGTMLGGDQTAYEYIKESWRPLLLVFLGIFIVLAFLTVWTLVGRIIVDSRRETAVFRAIGAKRMDIVAVYMLYSLGIGFRIIIGSTIVCAASVLIINGYYAQNLTETAHASYGLYNSTTQFSLIGVDAAGLWGIVACIIILALLSPIIPLLRNVRRNPISDMRDY